MGPIVLEKPSNKGRGERWRRGRREGTQPEEEVGAEARPGHSAGFGVSQEAPIRGSTLNGPPKPRTSITFDRRQEPSAGNSRLTRSPTARSKMFVCSLVNLTIETENVWLSFAITVRLTPSTLIGPRSMMSSRMCSGAE